MTHNVAVFCASADGVDPIYRKTSEALGRALAERNVGVIYGGAKVGLMCAVAEAALAAGRRVIGVIPEVLVDLEVAHHGITELYVTDTMHTRKALIGQRADAFIALPGGLGTLEELFEIIVGKQLRFHSKPIVLLNVAAFFDPLLAMLNHGIEHKFIKPSAHDLFYVADSTESALAHLENYQAPNVADKWLSHTPPST